MGENMNFPDNPLDFIKKYSFKDKLGIYTNGSMLVPLFRVEQMIEHYMNDFKNDNCIPVEKIKTVGDFRKITENLSDDFKLDVKIMKEVPEEELKHRSYPYP